VAALCSDPRGHAALATVALFYLDAVGELYRLLVYLFALLLAFLMVSFHWYGEEARRGSLAERVSPEKPETNARSAVVPVSDGSMLLDTVSPWDFARPHLALDDSCSSELLEEEQEVCSPADGSTWLLCGHTASGEDFNEPKLHTFLARALNGERLCLALCHPTLQAALDYVVGDEVGQAEESQGEQAARDACDCLLVHVARCVDARDPKFS
jgi:hypothetical protein